MIVCNTQLIFTIEIWQNEYFTYGCNHKIIGRQPWKNDSITSFMAVMAHTDAGELYVRIEFFITGVDLHDENHILSAIKSDTHAQSHV